MWLVGITEGKGDRWTKTVFKGWEKRGDEGERCLRIKGMRRNRKEGNGRLNWMVEMNSLVEMAPHSGRADIGLGCLHCSLLPPCVRSKADSSDTRAQARADCVSLQESVFLPPHKPCSLLPLPSFPSPFLLKHQNSEPFFWDSQSTFLWGDLLE